MEKFKCFGTFFSKSENLNMGKISKTLKYFENKTIKATKFLARFPTILYKLLVFRIKNKNLRKNLNFVPFFLKSENLNMPKISKSYKTLSKILLTQ